MSIDKGLIGDLDSLLIGAGHFEDNYVGVVGSARRLASAIEQALNSAGVRSDGYDLDISLPQGYRLQRNREATVIFNWARGEWLGNPALTSLSAVQFAKDVAAGMLAEWATWFTRTNKQHAHLAGQLLAAHAALTIYSASPEWWAKLSNPGDTGPFICACGDKWTNAGDFVEHQSACAAITEPDAELADFRAVAVLVDVWSKAPNNCVECVGGVVGARAAKALEKWGRG